MKSLTSTSSESRSNGRSTDETSIRPRSRLPEQVYLEREAALAKRAMRTSLTALGRAANPVSLMREHPVAAAVLVGGAAAALIARGLGQDNEAGPQEQAAESVASHSHGILHDVGRAVRSVLVSMLVSRVLWQFDGGEAGESDQPVN